MSGCQSASRTDSSRGEPDLASRLLAWFPTPIRQAGSLPAESANLADIQFREWLRLVTRATLRRSGFGVFGPPEAD